jgi:hypothetical protein
MVGLIMEKGILFTIIFGLVFSGVVILWVYGIDYMKKNRPDYKDDLDRPDFSHEEDDLYYNTNDNDEDEEK